MSRKSPPCPGREPSCAPCSPVSRGARGSLGSMRIAGVTVRRAVTGTVSPAMRAPSPAAERPMTRTASTGPECPGRLSARIVDDTGTTTRVLRRSACVIDSSAISPAPLTTISSRSRPCCCAACERTAIVSGSIGSVDRGRCRIAQSASGTASAMRSGRAVAIPPPASTIAPMAAIRRLAEGRQTSP